MIVLPPGLARRFAALARRCIVGRPHGPPPEVVCRTAGRVLTVHTRLPSGVGLTYTSDADGPDAVLVLPFELLSALTAIRGAVELRSTRGLQAEARWVDTAGPQSHPFTALKSGRSQPPLPDVDRVPCPPQLLAALHACGQATARSGSTARFALDRVCLAGATKWVIGSDGKTAVLAGPFPWPFADNRLVPAVPVFGCPELTAETTVTVGGGDGFVAVTAGPWCVRLPIVPGRYPDVAAVIPRQRPTVGGIDEGDARDLLAKLKTLPAGDDPERPVTLVLDGGVSVLTTDGTRTERVRLSRSTAAGPSVRVALDRTALVRAIKLGCFTAHVWTADKPVLLEGCGYQFVAAPLAEDDVVRDRVETTGAPDPRPSLEPNPTLPRRVPPPRRIDVKPPDPRRPDPLPVADTPDPLALAEHLRQSLADAHTTAARLVAMLKGRRKEQKALSQVFASLKSLNLTPGGE